MNSTSANSGQSTSDAENRLRVRVEEGIKQLQIAEAGLRCKARPSPIVTRQQIVAGAFKHQLQRLLLDLPLESEPILKSTEVLC